MTLSQSSSSSSLYASPVGRFSSTGFGMYDIEEGSSRSGGRGGVRKDKDPRKHEEELINAYEAEEERIINVLSKKLEQLREDKIDLENALEAESESHVNRLSRELGALRKANRELEERLGERERLDREGNSSGSSKGKGKGKGRSGSSSSEQDGKTKVKKNGKSRTVHSSRRSSSGLSRVASSSRTTTLDDTTLVAFTPITSSTVASPSPTPLTVSTRNLKQYQHHTQDDISNPSATLVMDALQRENEQLRTKLVDMEREFGRVKRLNEVYREELISVRGKLGQPVDHLIGFTPSERDPFEHPTHVRSRTGKEREKDTPSPKSSSTSMAMSYKPRFVHDAGGGHSTYYQQPVSNGHTYGHAQIHSSPAVTGTSSMSMPIPRPPSQIRHRPAMNEDMDGPFLGVDVDDYLDDDLSSSPTSSRRPAGATSHSSGAGRNSGDTILSPTPSTPSSVSSASLLYPFSDSSPVTSSVLRSGGGGALGGSSNRGGEPASYVSVETDVTSLPSSGSLGMMGMHANHHAHMMNAHGNGVGMGGMVMGGIGLGAYGVPQRGLSYPSVPPPSLSSSFGSPSVSAFAFGGGGGGGNERGESISPIESRRGSIAGLAASRRGSVNDVGGGSSSSSSNNNNNAGRRVVESGSLRSVPVGARVAEMGTLSGGGRSRAGSMNPNNSSPSILREEVDEDADS